MTADPNTNLTYDERYVAELERAVERIWEIAQRFGLDPYPTNFELVPATIMYEFGSYGLPGRFSHWSRGKAYYRMKTEYDYGLSKIYELVVNTNPSYAFLMEQNDLLQNKVVVAHVLGHTDFFKHNAYFKHTSGNMIDKVSVNADRIRKYEFDHGQAAVERFLDAVLAIEEHIDPNFRIKPESATPQQDNEPKKHADSPYDDLWSLAERAARKRDEDIQAWMRTRRRRFPAQPQKDLLLFLAQYAPNLEEWQRDILMIVREEMQYFVPQMQTKVANEGWASYWHARTMRELDLSDGEFAAFAQMHSGVLAPQRMRVNPYHLGYHILQDIERRWDNPTEEERVKLGREPGKGREKLFAVRETESDVSLLRNYLTKELVEELDLYLYRKEEDEWVIVEKNWEKVRDGLVASMTNFGYPYITVVDADFNGNTELVLHHQHEGQDLDLSYAQKTLEYVQYIWSRPVHLETILEEQAVRLSYNGEKHSRVALDKGKSKGE
ncbi:MAG: Spore cortex synthesis protein SpoVR [Ktedonobacterales bacterium]|jgi:stage V sporulation protein R|nr:MAG: Spore cortex synthesis protein SpoVR [Ktedonobacterales bacterium]